MLVKIKPHSTLRHLFAADEMLVDIDSYIDIMYYFNALQPAYMNYLRALSNSTLEEGVVYLDSKLRQISSDEFMIRRAKEHDTIHIVPGIYGGGGKRGNILKILAAVALFVVAPYAAPAIGEGLAGAGFFAAGGQAAFAAGTATTALEGATALATSFVSNMVMNIGLALLAQAFLSPKETSDSSTRENNMFGSLVNSTENGTPIPLNYGLVRVAGQMLSGYVKNEDDSTKGSTALYINGQLVQQINSKGS